MSTTSTAGVTRIDRTEAKALAAAEFEKFAALTASLPSWFAPRCVRGSESTEGSI